MRPSALIPVGRRMDGAYGLRQSALATMAFLMVPLGGCTEASGDQAFVDGITSAVTSFVGELLQLGLLQVLV